MAAGADSQEKIVVSIANSTGTDSILYTLNPDGSAKTRLFDFHNHPQDPNAGMWDLRVGPGGGQIYFSSDNAYLFTPAARNIFRIGAAGNGWDQVTPGPNSGRWDQGCPCGTVTGIVRYLNGDPIGGAPVLLEGKTLVNAGANGRFRFDNVPEGRRWIVAYEALGEDTHEAQAISVYAGLATDVILTPQYVTRMTYEQPVAFGGRIYYRYWPNRIQWTTADFAPPVEVYRTAGACSGIPDVDGFDVGPVSGRLAILNYETGCGAGDAEHQGLYLADKDGNNIRLLVNMMADFNWGGSVLAQGVFWSPNESRIAIDALYGGNPVVVLFDAVTGAFLGGVSYGPTWDATFGVHLDGWSPDGNWLLYRVTEFKMGAATTADLLKIRVNGDGTLPLDTISIVLEDLHLVGATWGRLTTSPAQQKLYLPMLMNT